MFKWISFLTLSLLFWGCSKSLDTLPVQELNVGTDTWVNDVVFLPSGEIYACGGQRMERGLAFNRSSEGVWSTSQFIHERNGSCVARHGLGENSRWWVGGDMLFVYETTDWVEWNRRPFQEQVPLHEMHRPQIREIKIDGQEIWFVGGENLYQGVIYHSWDGGDNWSFSVWDHELRDIEFYGDYSIVVGHGVILRSYQGEEYEIIKTGDFFISAEFDDEGNLIIVTNQGAILRSSNFGDSFDEVLPPRPGQRSYLDLTIDDQNQFLACGAEGIVSTSNNGGFTWEHYRINGNPPLTSVSEAEGAYCFGSNEGRLFLSDYPS